MAWAAFFKELLFCWPCFQGYHAHFFWEHVHFLPADVRRSLPIKGKLERPSPSKRRQGLQGTQPPRFHTFQRCSYKIGVVFLERCFIKIPHFYRPGIEILHFGFGRIYWTATSVAEDTSVISAAARSLAVTASFDAAAGIAESSPSSLSSVTASTPS